MAEWQIDPAVLEVLNGRANLTADTFNRIFGATSVAGIGDYPYSLQRMFYPPADGGVGLGPDNLADQIYMQSDVELTGGFLDQTTVGGVWSGVYDVTAFGAVGDGSTNDYTAIKAAIDAAQATMTASPSTSRVATIYFPKTQNGTYAVSPGSAIPGVEIKPNFMYIAAQGVTVRRTDGSYGAGVDPGVFGTSTDWAGATNPGVVIRGFKIDGSGGGVHGIKVVGGGWASIERCVFYRCFKDAAGYNRSGVFLYATKCASIRDCRFEDCDNSWFTYNCAAWCAHNVISFQLVTSFVNCGSKGLVRCEDTSTFQPVYYGNSFVAPRIEGAIGSGNKPSALAMAGTGCVALGNVVDMSAAKNYQDGIEISDNYTGGKYNIAIGNTVLVTNRATTAVLQLRGITAEQNDHQVIMDNVVSGPRGGGNQFAFGIKTTQRAGATTYGLNRVNGNQVGPGVSVSYALNNDTAHGDVFQEVSYPINVARAKLSNAIPSALHPPDVDWKWSPLGIGITDGAVATACVVEDKLVVAGSFTKAGYYSLAYIGYLSNTRWNDIGAAAPNAQVIRVVPQAGGQDKNSLRPHKDWDQTVLVCGAFTSYGGGPGRGVALLNLQEQSVSYLARGINTGSAYDGQFFDGETFGATTVSGWLIVGDFTSLVKADSTTQTVKRVALYNATTADWSAWPASTLGVNDGTVKCVLGFGARSAIVGGSFTNVQNSGGAQAANNIAVCHDVGGTEGFYRLRTSNAGFNGAVNAMVNVGFGAVLVGGAFTKDGGSSAAYNHIALLLTKSSSSEDWVYVNVGSIAGTVYSIRKTAVFAAPFSALPHLSPVYVICYDGGISLLFLEPVDPDSSGNPQWKSLIVPVPLENVGGAKVIFDAVAIPDRDVLVAVGNFLPRTTAQAYGQDLNQRVY